MGREGSGGLHRASEPGGKGSQRCFPSRHLPTGDRGATSARPCYVGFNVAARGLEKSLQSRHQPTSRKRISLGVARSPTNINLMHSPPTTRFALMGSPFAGRRFQFSYDNHLKSCEGRGDRPRRLSGLFSVTLRVTERRMYRDSIGREAKDRATRRHIVRHMKQPT